MKYHHPVTPAEISSEITLLCEEIFPKGDLPVLVQCEPIPGAPTRECFPLVEEKIRQAGGEIVYGWCIWELPSVFVEAEFHAVWRSPGGQLWDIAPKLEPTKSILFFQDDSRVYEGRQINNFRRPLRQHPLIHDFIQLCDEEYEFVNRGDRALQHGEIQLTGADAWEYEQLQMKKARLQFEMLSMVPEVWLYGPCPCGSGKKTKWCHRMT